MGTAPLACQHNVLTSCKILLVCHSEMLVGVHAKAIEAPLFCTCRRAGDSAPGDMTGRMLYSLWTGGPLL